MYKDFIPSLPELKLATKSEFLKYKRSSFILFCMFFNIGLLSLMVMGVSLGQGELALTFGNAEFYKFILLYTGMHGLVVISVITIMYTSIVANIEKKNGIDVVRTLFPISPFSTYIAKVFKIFSFVLMNMLIISLTLVLYYFILFNYIEMPIDFNMLSFGLVLLNAVSISFLLVPVIMIHLWIGLRLKLKFLNQILGLFLILVLNIWFYFKPSIDVIPYVNFTKYIQIIDINFSANKSSQVELLVYNAFWILLIGGLTFFDIKRSSKY